MIPSWLQTVLVASALATSLTCVGIILNMWSNLRGAMKDISKLQVDIIEQKVKNDQQDAQHTTHHVAIAGILPELKSISKMVELVRQDIRDASIRAHGV